MHTNPKCRFITPSRDPRDSVSKRGGGFGKLDSIAGGGGVGLGGGKLELQKKYIVRQGYGNKEVEGMEERNGWGEELRGVQIRSYLIS